MSSIEWTTDTWNIVVGCRRVSAGCERCYAERLAVRLPNMGQSVYAGLTNGDLRGPRWTGEVRFVEDRLAQPRRWRTPRLVFTPSMGDLLHEGVTTEQVARVVAVMRDTRRHTYQVLTKRPERLARLWNAGLRWPENVWLGVSVESQRAADERLPLLLARRYAPVRWVSYEPALAPVDWRPWAGELDWIVAGGESGPGARPFDLAWARQAIEAFHGAGKPVFIKQLGTVWAGKGKGNHLDAWPRDLRVREWPAGDHLPSR